MLRFTELVYLAAPFERPEERAFNQRLAKLVRAYNFPLFMPQEAVVEIAESGGCLADWQPRPELLEQGCHEGNLDQYVMEACMDALNRANLVIAVFYGEEFDPLTAFEVGYALGRRTNVVAVQNTLEPTLLRSGSLSRLTSPQVCSRVVIAPHDDEYFPDRLIPILNRYFVPHKL
jgi:nucleoside 2-deoxyribosyltransferase